MSKEFDEYWQSNRERLLREDPEYKQATDEYKLRSGADWLLFGIPIVSGIVTLQYLQGYESMHELVRFGIAVLVIIAVSVICIFVKSLTSPHRALSDIEKDVRARALVQWKKEKSDKN